MTSQMLFILEILIQQSIAMGLFILEILIQQRIAMRQQHAENSNGVIYFGNINTTKDSNETTACRD
jgi:hypothetical protein